MKIFRIIETSAMRKADLENPDTHGSRIQEIRLNWKE